MFAMIFARKVGMERHLLASHVTQIVKLVQAQLS